MKSNINIRSNIVICPCKAPHFTLASLYNVLIIKLHLGVTPISSKKKSEDEKMIMSSFFITPKTRSICFHGSLKTQKWKLQIFHLFSECISSFISFFFFFLTKPVVIELSRNRSSLSNLDKT